MDISSELEAAKAEIDKEVQNFVAFLNQSKNTQLANAQDYLIAVREFQADLLTKQTTGQAVILLESLKTATQDKLKLLGDAELRTMNFVWRQQDKAVALINSGI